ncbi:MAG: vWA domain-containing protein [Myxococcota bacterium]
MLQLLTLVVAGCSSEPGLGQAPDPVALDETAEPQGEIQVDTFVQATVPTSDVLFVVDNSCSMENEQSALGGNFSSFLDVMFASEIDFHIGVVATDMTDPDHQGRLRSSGEYRWIDPETPDAALRFASMVGLGIDGDPQERGRAAAFTALEVLADGWNQGFLRRDASLHLVVVSDENDASGPEPIGRDEFVGYLRGLKVAPFTTTFSSVVGPKGAQLGPFSPCSAEYGAEYLAVTDAVGGLDQSICEEDWGALLGELGSVASGLRTEFFLTRRPVPESISVEVERDGELEEFEGPRSGWIHQARRNQVAFVGYLPPEGAIVRVRYEIEE